MAALTYKIGADTSKLKRGLAGARKMLGTFSKAVATGGLAAAAGGIAALGIGIKKSLTLSGEMEQLETAFAVLTGSAETARKTIKELIDLSDVTPLKPEEVVEAGKMLMAFGFSAEEVAGNLAMVGDVSTGVGSSLKDMTYLFGTSRTQGKLMSRDLLQFTNRGVPMIEALTEVLGVSKARLQEMITAGEVGFPSVLKAFQLLTSKGGKFGGMMERQSKTFFGLISTLRGKLNSLLRDFGKPLMDSLKPVLDSLIKTASSFAPRMREIGKAVGNAAAMLVEAFKRGEILMMAGQAFKAGALYVGDQMLKALKAGAMLFGSLLLPIFQHLASKFQDERFWAGWFYTLKGIFKELTGNLQSLLSQLLEKMGNQAASDKLAISAGETIVAGRESQAIGAHLRQIAGDGQTFGQVFEDAFLPAVRAAQGAYEENSGVTHALNREWGKFMDQIKVYGAEVAKQRAQAAADAKEQKGGVVPPLPKPGEGLGGGLGGRMKATVTSLQRVGGAALTGALSLDQKRNSLLEKIAKNTKQAPAAVAG